MKLGENERIDNLHRNDYVIIQDTKRFCFGMDAVLLSSFAEAKKGDFVMDIGTGTGIIPILMCAKTSAEKFDAIDVQEKSVFMAKRSVELNKLEDKINIVHCDIKNVFGKFKKNFYDVVTVNPPYMDGNSIPNDFTPKSIARHEILCTLEDIVKNSSELLKNRGSIYMIHRSKRLVDVISTFRQYKLEPKKIRFIQSYEHKEPNLFLVKAVKNANPELKIMPNLIIYKRDGKYTEEVFDIYYN